MGFVVKITMLERVFEMLCPDRCVGCGRLGWNLCECCKKNIGKAVVERGESEVGQGGMETGRGVGEEEAKEGDGGEVMNGMARREKRGQMGEMEWREDGMREGEREGEIIPCLVAVGRREPALMKLVKRYKYEGAKRIAEVLAGLLGKAMVEVKNELVGEVIVVPLPTIRRHIRERGFDHTLRLAEVLAERNGWKCCQLLARGTEGVQVGMSAEKRQEQARGAYMLKFGEKIDQNATYVLLDDVWTTGASMRAAAEALRRAGVKKVVALVVVKGE